MLVEQVDMAQVRPRFVYAELRPFADNETLITVPEGEMFHLAVPPQEMSAVLQQCDGTKTIHEIATTTSDPETFADILMTLMETNALSQKPAITDEVHWARFPQAEIDPTILTTTRAILIGDEHLFDLAQDLQLLPPFASTTVATISTLANTLTTHPPEQLVVIALHQWFDAAFLQRVDAICHEAKVRWVQFHIDQGVAWLGPAIVPHHTANYRDLLIRRATVADDPDVYQARLALPVQAPPLPSSHELIWMLSTFFIEVERWLTAASANLLSSEIAVDPVTLERQIYPVLPLPDHLLDGDLQIGAEKNADLLLNERAGIVIRAIDVKHHPAIPDTLKTVQLNLARMINYDENWHNDGLSGGSAFGDVRAAHLAALGEAAERYCGNYFPGANPIKASYNELRNRGEYALDPEQLILFSPQIYDAAGCPFTPFARDLPVYWVEGRSLTKNCPAWLPMMFVYVNWNVSGFDDIPALCSAYYPGLAAGPNREHALVSGIQELIERDAMMIWWLNRQSLPAVRLSTPLQALWAGRPTELGQRAWAIYLPNEFDIPVMVGVVENTKEQLLNIGFACRSQPEPAILKAWTEALTLQEGSRDLLDPDGLTRQGIEWNLVPDVLKDWRADRTYLQDFRPDFRDVTDLLLQQQFFLDPQAIEQVRPWLDTPATLELDHIPTLADRALATYQKQVEVRGYEIFYADLTSSDVAHAGLDVVRVLIPGLVPNFPAAFPPTGHGRVQNVPVQLGWRATPVPEEALNYMPMPYA